MKITIYSTANCAACHELTNWLDKLNMEYQKKITDEDPAAMEEFMTVNDGMIGVPFTIFENDNGSQIKVSGFDQGRIRQALGM